jgi:hypothetical protein
VVTGRSDGRNESKLIGMFELSVTRVLYLRLNNSAGSGEQGNLKEHVLEAGCLDAL